MTIAVTGGNDEFGSSALASLNARTQEALVAIAARGGYDQGQTLAEQLSDFWRRHV